MIEPPRTIEVSVYVVRAFVKLREILRSHKELAGKLDEGITLLFEVIRQLMESPEEPSKRIGFHA